MALSFLSGSGNASSVKHFEIRVEESNLILRGYGEDATSAQLKGKLVLCLSQPLKVQNIHMRFTGETKISFPNTQGPRAGRGIVKQERECHRVNWDFVSTGRSETLAAGNYEYPFETILPGDMAESVEGFSDCWIVYRMKASIDRGILASNIHARKHIRVIRSFKPDALELVHAMSLENVWPDKIDYTIGIPAKAVIFGTNINVEFILVPLLKGLKIGRISTILVETQDMIVECIAQPKREYSKTRTVAVDQWELGENAETEELNGREGYSFIRSLSLPKNLRGCVQTVEAKGIKVKHRLKFIIQLLNPDGHVSELRATLPVHIFISPSLPLDEQNNLVDQTPQSIQTTEELIRNAPPMYGEHYFDQIYSDIDPSGYMTPSATSGINTPYHSHSRNGSVEDLASTDTIPSNNFSPNSLQNRLSNMQIPDPGRWARDRAHASGGNPPASGSYDTTIDEELFQLRNSMPQGDGFRDSTRSNTRHDHSDPVSRRGSEDESAASGTQTPVHIERMRADELCRVPSYGTALKTPVKTSSSDLPDYELAISRPPTPPLPISQNSNRNRTAWNSPDGSSSSAALPAQDAEPRSRGMQGGRRN